MLRIKANARRSKATTFREPVWLISGRYRSNSRCLPRLPSRARPLREADIAVGAYRVEVSNNRATAASYQTGVVVGYPRSAPEKSSALVDCIGLKPQIPDIL
jgi:hypothetical protein